MFMKKFFFIALAMSFAFGTMSMYAQDAGALLDLMVRKKLITDQDAEEVRAELTKQYSETNAGKWKLSTPITELELYGDIRVRYQYNGGRTDNTPVAAPGTGVAGFHDWQESGGARYA